MAFPPEQNRKTETAIPIVEYALQYARMGWPVFLFTTKGRLNLSHQKSKVMATKTRQPMKSKYKHSGLTTQQPVLALLLVKDQV